MGSCQELSSEQLRSLSEFKEKVADVIKPNHDDYYLVRWLKARSFNVSKAEQMFRASLAFREKMKVDSLLENYKPPEVLQKYIPGGICGYDKEGSPIWLELIGNYDLKGLMMSARKSDLEKIKLLQCEICSREIEKQSAKLGRRIEGVTMLFDLENIGTKFLWRPGAEMYLHLIQMMEDNYPEMAKKLIAANVPSIIPILFRIARPMLSEDTLKKVVILGSNYKTELLKFADADQIPSYLGGSLTDPDQNPRCLSMIRQGGTIPKSYYLSETLDASNIETASIPHGGSLKIDFNVTRPGSVIRWEFKTQERNIGFGVNFKGENGDQVEIVPMKRVNSHLVTEDDTIKCTQLGTYTVVFDNSFSWIRSKKLLYHVELHEVDEDTEKEVETHYLNNRD